MNKHFFQIRNKKQTYSNRTQILSLYYKNIRYEMCIQDKYRIRNLMNYAFKTNKLQTKFQKIFCTFLLYFDKKLFVPPKIIITPNVF